MGYKVSRLLSAECTFTDNDGTECKTEHFFRGKEFDSCCIEFQRQTQSRLGGVQLAKLRKLAAARKEAGGEFENINPELLGDIKLGEMSDADEQARFIDIYDKTIESAKGYDTDDGSTFSPVDHVPPSHKQKIVQKLMKSRIGDNESKNSPKASGE